jgi:hypothetical protein
LAAALVVATSACKIDVNLTTTVARDGSGDFKVEFVIDKELADLARNSGEDPFAVLSEIPASLPAGWRFDRSDAGGGLRVMISRHFPRAKDLNDALADLEAAAAAQAGPTARFFKLRLRRSSSFLRTRTAISGSIDLSSAGLLGAVNLPADTVGQLQSLMQQSGSQFFLFTMKAMLPGKVATAGGEPHDLDGGTVTWTPRLGDTIRLSAEASALNTAGVAAIGGPAVVVAAALALMLVRRRRDRASPPETVAGLEPIPPAEPVAPEASADPPA